MKHFSGFVVIDRCTYRDLDFEVFAIAAMPITALAVPATFGPERVIESKL